MNSSQQTGGHAAVETVGFVRELDWYNGDFKKKFQFFAKKKVFPHQESARMLWRNLINWATKYSLLLHILRISPPVIISCL